MNQNHERPVAEDEPYAKRRHIDKTGSGSGQRQVDGFSLEPVIDLTEMNLAEYDLPSPSLSSTEIRALSVQANTFAAQMTMRSAVEAQVANAGENKSGSSSTLTLSYPSPLSSSSASFASLGKITTDEQFKMADKALQEQEKAIKRQQAEMRWQRFLYYSNGESCPKDDAAAYPFLMAAIELDHTEARFTLAEWCRTGRGAMTAMLPNVAYTQYLLAATAGHTRAKFHLGRCLDEGFGCVKNIPQAMIWYKAAADDGLAEAQHTYAHMLESECCGPDNINRNKYQSEAIRYYTLAACQGSITSLNSLGWCYFYGKTGKGETKQDEKQAVEWFSHAAAKGIKFSQYGLGLCFVHGKGVNKDLGQAVSWLGKAAEQGYQYALEDLVAMFDQGKWGAIQDEAKAFFWTRKAAILLGTAYWQSCLSAMYFQGKGTRQDAKEAFDWMLKAANQGLAQAQHNVGLNYETGHGVAIDFAKAFEWYTKAANQGVVLSMCAVAEFNETGRHTHGQVNLSQAAFWYRRAAHANNAVAALQLGLLLKQWPTGNWRLEGEEASKWFKQAAEQGNARAQYEYAYTIYNVSNVTKDKRENKYFEQASLAYPWFVKAAEQKLARAQANVASLLHHGQGVDKDEAKAISWLRECINNPNHLNAADIPVACSNLSVFLERLPPSSDDTINKARIKESIALTERSANDYYIPAIYSLATWYHKGKSDLIPKDLNKALQLYRQVIHLEKQSQWSLHVNYTTLCIAPIAQLEKELTISHSDRVGSLGPSHEAKVHDKDLCKICYERPIDCVLLNCGHLAVCMTCSSRIGKTCPICRQTVSVVKAIYHS